MPNPVNPPKACRFHPRCPFVQERCREVEPLLEDAAKRARGGLPPLEGAVGGSGVKAREAWLLRNGLAAALLALAWNTIPLRPLRVLVVLIHDRFHALASLLSGGGVLSIEVLSYSGGVTTLAGGSPLLVYSAGYLGTALLGSVLLAAAPWPA